MATVTLIQPANLPTARLEGPRGGDSAHPAQSFKDLINGDRRLPDDNAAAAETRRAESGAEQSDSRAVDNDKDSASDDRDERDVNGDIASGDPRGVLDWLQSQLASQPSTASNAPTLTQVAVADQQAAQAAAGGNAAPLTGALSGVAAIIGKFGTGAGDTPPTQAPKLDAAAAIAAVQPDGGADRFHLPLSLVSDPAGGSPTLSPALRAALDAVVTTDPANATDVIATGVQAFQAQLHRLGDAAPSLAAAPVNTAEAATLPTTPLTLDHAELPQRLVERVQWLNVNGIQEARLQLHPQDLGTINVQVRVEGGGASVWFAAEHPAARAALEATLPQLRERLQGDGLAFNQAQVATQTSGWNFGSSGQQASRDSGSSGGSGGFSAPGRDTGISEIEAAPERRAIVHVGLVDRYV